MTQYEKEKYPSHSLTHTQLSDEHILLIEVLFELTF